MQGMDSVYVHVTDDMRQQLCGYLDKLWHEGIADRYKLAPRSAVPLLDQILVAHEQTIKRQGERRSAEKHGERPASRRTRPPGRSAASPAREHRCQVRYPSDHLSSSNYFDLQNLRATWLMGQARG